MRRESLSDRIRGPGNEPAEIRKRLCFAISSLLRQGRFGRNEGQGLVEYALIIALVAVAVVGSLGAFADPVDGFFGGILANRYVCLFSIRVSRRPAYNDEQSQ